MTQVVADTGNYLAVGIGLEIQKSVPGRVSSEVDAGLSLKLAEGIRLFTRDQEKLESRLVA